MVYADSLTPVSANELKFTSSRVYPSALKDFEKSFSFLETTPCDVLITAHPDFSSCGSALLAASAVLSQIQWWIQVPAGNLPDERASNLPNELLRSATCRRRALGEFSKRAFQDCDHPVKVFLRVYADAIVRRLRDEDRNSILQESELLQALRSFERRLGKSDEAIEGIFPDTVKAEVLEVTRVGRVAVEGDRGAGKVEGAARQVRHHFNGVWNFAMSIAAAGVIRVPTCAAGFCPSRSAMRPSAPNERAVHLLAR